MRNLRKMAQTADKHGLVYRPHFKTHQSAAVADWHRELGIRRITVSSLQMAAYFASHGWEDITVAFPVNLREMATINQLAGKINLQLVAESAYSLARLQEELSSPVRIYLKTDTGYHRTGIAAVDTDTFDRLLALLEGAPLLHFAGFLAHAGHSYSARNRGEILLRHEEALSAMQALEARYRSRYPDMVLSLGDTPTMSHAQHFGPINEIRPGNLLFYDLMQVQIGSCSHQDIAVAMACPVVAKHPDRQEIVLYGGGVHFSKEQMMLDGHPCFGLPVQLQEDGRWSSPLAGSYMKKLSQEHGILHASPALMQSLQPGDLIGILPVHSCMTADCMGRYLSLEGSWLEMMPRY